MAQIDGAATDPSPNELRPLGPVVEAHAFGAEGPGFKSSRWAKEEEGCFGQILHGAERPTEVRGCSAP